MGGLGAPHPKGGHHVLDADDAVAVDEYDQLAVTTSPDREQLGLESPLVLERNLPCCRRHSNCKTLEIPISSHPLCLFLISVPFLFGSLSQPGLTHSLPSIASPLATPLLLRSRRPHPTTTDGGWVGSAAIDPA